MNISKMKRSTQIAIMTGVGSGAVEKTVTGTAPLTLSDSVVGNILGITINGRSDVNAGSIVSVGDNGLTVTTTNSDSTVTTSAVVTTALPLRGVSAVRDKLICTAESKQVETVCEEKDLSTLTWTMSSTSAARTVFYTTDIDDAYVVTNNANVPLFLCNTKNVAAYGVTWDGNMVSQDIDGKIYITTPSTITNVTALMEWFTNNPTILVYALATPTVTPLTDAEISALTSLSTYDPTTIISVTDNPSITVKYMGKNITRTAPKKRSNRKKKS